MSKSGLINRRQFSSWVGAGLLGVSAGGVALAQDWPAKPIKLISPSTAGGSTDIIARLVGERLSAALGQNVIVEARPGGNGVIGSTSVATSPPDGYTLLLGGLPFQILGTAIMKDPPHDGVKDFTHIAYLGGVPFMFVVPADAPARNLQEFADWAKSQPAPLPIAATNTGSQPQFMLESFERQAGFKMIYVPYQGGVQVASAVAGHQVVAAMVSAPSAAPLLEARSVRLLAIAMAERVPKYPDVPTFSESGYKEIAGPVWFTLSGPPGMPKAIVERLNAEVRKGLASPEAQKVMATLGIVSEEMDPETLLKFYETENARWAPLANAYKN